jgi:hypothetical protein
VAGQIENGGRGHRVQVVAGDGVDAHDLELGITESGRSGGGVAGQDPYLLAVTHKRLSQ